MFPVSMEFHAEAREQEPLLPFGRQGLRGAQLEVIMAYKKTTKLPLTLLALVTASSLLGACHTMAGAGKDIKATGQALQDSAQGSSQDSANDRTP